MAGEPLNLTDSFSVVIIHKVCLGSLVVVDRAADLDEILLDSFFDPSVVLAVL
jgi:hypothetical protein